MGLTVPGTVPPGTYSTVGDVRRFRQKLALTPSTAKIVLIGDSSSDASGAAVSLRDRLRNFHTQRGQALDGATTTNIVAQGNSGITLAVFLAESGGTFKYTADLLPTAPDLVIASYGLNDVRLGLTTKAQMVTMLTTLVTNLRRDLPAADIVLRIPNAFTTTAGGSVKEVDGTTNASAATVQAYSTLLREAYLELQDVWPNVLVADVQANVFGVQSLATHPLMGDQLHPSTATFSVNSVPQGGGYVAIADYLAGLIGFAPNPFPPDVKSFRWRQKFIVGAGGNGFLDLYQADPLDVVPAQQPIVTGDSLFIAGLAAPIAVPSTSNIFRPQSGTNVRLLISGTDFTSYVGRAAVVAGAHAGPTTEDRQIVAVDLPSIAATSFGTVTATVTGARTGALHDATSVLCTPPASFETAGLYLLSCVPSANDTVRLVVYNPTGGAVDLASANFAFWVVR